MSHSIHIQERRQAFLGMSKGFLEETKPKPDLWNLLRVRLFLYWAHTYWLLITDYVLVIKIGPGHKSGINKDIVPITTVLALLNIYPAELKTHARKNPYMNVLSGLFVIAPNWKQVWYSWMKEGVRKMGSSHTVECYSGIQRKELSIYTTLLNLRWICWVKNSPTQTPAVFLGSTVGRGGEWCW